MNKSLRYYLIKNFILIVFLTILFLEIAVIISVKNYYYNDAITKLKDQAELNLNYLNRYIDFSKGIENVVLEDSLTFYQYNTGHLVILDSEGDLLLSTIGLTNNLFDKENLLYNIKNKGYFNSIDNFEYLGGNIATVALPILSQDKFIGICLFQSNLSEADNAIYNIGKLVIIIGITVLCISTIASYLLSIKISKPIKELTLYADHLAKGNYNFDHKPSGPKETVKLGASMNYMKEEILKRELVKNEFIANISHELKTPLTSIKGWAYTLEYDPSDQALLSEGLKIIESETDRLSDMVNDLLDFSRLLNKKVKLEIHDFDLIKLLNEIEMQFRPRALEEEKAINLNSEFKNLVISGDRDKLKQVFINLLDNAFKFTSKDGKIEIMVNKHNNNYVDITIADDGEGISGKDIDHIFEKFYRGSSSKSHTGIGLSIAQEIVELSKGIIRVESREGDGSRFIISLPLEIKEDEK